MARRWAWPMNKEVRKAREDADKNQLSGNGWRIYFVEAPHAVRLKLPIWILQKDGKNRLAERLGLVKFNGAWRQYCFYPDEGTVWSAGCLEFVYWFIRDRNKEFRALRKKK